MTMATSALQPLRGLRIAWRRFARGIGDLMPKGLFARSLIIIIAPVVLLQALVASVFMEEHWQQVTARLSAAVVADIAAIVDLIERDPGEANLDEVTKIAKRRLGLNIAILPPEAGRATASSSPADRRVFELAERVLTAGLRLRQFLLDIGTRLRGARGGGDRRVLQFAERVLAADLGLLQLGLHFLRAQAGLLGQGGRIVQLAEGVLAAVFRFLQFSRHLGAALRLLDAGGLCADTGQGQG